MLKTLLNKIENGIDVRQSVSALRKDIKNEDQLNELFDMLFDDATVISNLLESDDSKTRKNTALLMGDLQMDDFVEPLFDAYEKETTLFVKSAYLNALKGFDYSEYMSRLHARVKELSATEITDDNKKHINEEMRALNELIIQVEGIRHHKFKGYDNIHDCVLLTNKLYPQITSSQIETVKTADFNAGVRVTTTDLKELLSIRTYTELLFSISKMTSCPNDPVKAAHVMADSYLLSTLKNDHKGAAPFYFRIELKSKMPLDKKSTFSKKLASELERLTNRQLINSPSDYEIEIRLIESKDGHFNILVKYMTINDSRFAYREGTVAASIKPVDAALMVELAKEYMIPDAQVLDPFCGVGTMLIERQNIVKAHSSYGIDINRDAIDKAEQNTINADQIVHYINRNFFDFTHEYKFDEIFTNMPWAMGHTSDREICDLYTRFFPKAKSLLSEHGTIIMLTHDKEFAEHTAIKNGFKIPASFEISPKTGTDLLILKL